MGFLNGVGCEHESTKRDGRRYEFTSWCRECLWRRVFVLTEGNMIGIVDFVVM
jgi:hypothetical protein